MPDHAEQLATLSTPCLLIDETKMTRNIERLANRANDLGVLLRPHLKTVKSVDAAYRQLTGRTGPATVSTLAEAEVFAAAGINDIVYAVGISPQKLERVLALRQGGCDLVVILDSIEQAKAVAKASRDSGLTIPAMIEIDSDGHRSGLLPDDSVLITVGKILSKNGAELRGVLAHAGESYGAVGSDVKAAFAEQERAAVVGAAEELRAAGLLCPVVSVGSTPTAHFAKDLTGVTEMRAGVYVFFDLVMAGIGVCTEDDIALSVLTTVIGHQRDRNWIIVDAGWMAMSRDRGTAPQQLDQGYGIVCDVHGSILSDLIVIRANQEHGIIACRPGSDARLPELEVGTLLRILPNHACATAAQHQAYHVLPTDDKKPLLLWPRFSGW